jgi:hypothetical protein
MIHCHVATLLTSHAKSFQRNPVLVTAFDKKITLFKMHKKLSSKDGLKIIFGRVLLEGPVSIAGFGTRITAIEVLQNSDKYPPKSLLL